MADLFVRHNGSTVEPTELRVNEGGVEAQEGFVRWGGQLHRFWPQRDPEIVSTFNAIETKSWRDNWGWRDDTSKPELSGGYNDRVYQGEWSDPPPYGNHRGYWFYDFANIQSVLQADGGRRIERIEIFMRRREINGYWRPADIYLWTHRLTSPPGGKPALRKGPVRIGALDRGDAAWFDVPLSWGRDLRDGAARGFALFRQERGPYAIMDGLTNHAQSGQLRITHS